MAGSSIKDAHEQSIWDEVFSSASELEAFEPRLAGLQDGLHKLANGVNIPSEWYARAMPCLKEEVIVTLSFELHEIAGLHYQRGDLHSAAVICYGALALCTASLGEGHPSTMTIAGNYQKLQEALNAAAAAVQDSASAQPPYAAVDQSASCDVGKTRADQQATAGSLETTGSQLPPLRKFDKKKTKF